MASDERAPAPDVPGVGKRTGAVRRKRTSAPACGNRLGPTAWAAARDEYVTGDETYAEIAKRYGVSAKAVEFHAHNREANLGKTWAQLRAEFHDDVSGRTQERVAESVSRVLAEVREKAAVVSKLALARIEAKLSGDVPVEDRDLVQMAKLATGVKIELGGDPHGAPLSIRTTLDTLTADDLRKLAEGA